MHKQLHDGAAINALLEQLITSTNTALAAIDDSLAHIAKSDRRIAAMEAEARKQRNS